MFIVVRLVLALRIFNKFETIIKMFSLSLKNIILILMLVVILIISFDLIYMSIYG